MTVTEENGWLLVHGPKGELTVRLLPYTEVKIADKELVFTINSKIKQALSNWGTIRAHVQNAIQGVVDGFKKELEIEGVGFKAASEGDSLVLNLGYSHPVKFKAPAGISITVEKNTITVSGINKEIVGQTAASIRALKKPEPYKGKGLRYKNEVIRRKEGKKVAGTAA